MNPLLDYEAAMGVAKERTEAAELFHSRNRVDASRTRELRSCDDEMAGLLENEEPIRAEPVGA
jgi:hypothetical protein